MYKLMRLFLVALMCWAFVLNAQEGEFDELTIEIDEAMEEVQMEIDAAMEELEGVEGLENIKIDITGSSSKTPKMGVYLSNLDFEDIYEMHYDYNYGVYVSGVTTNGPAQNAGIMKDDIIMEFDGEKVRFERHLVNLIKGKQIGDTVDVKLFRLGKIYETELSLDTLKKKDKDMIITKTGQKKKKLSVGHGSGGWLPVWFTSKNEFADINFVLTEFGFNGLDDKGIFMNGGGGKGNVGKGWFLGGMGAGYEIDRKKGITTTAGEEVTRRINYSIGYGGVTLDKRFAISRKIVTSLGFMLGWGGHSLELSQTDGNYDWNTLNAGMDNSANNSIMMERSYILFQPKAMVMIRVLDWLGFRAEAGYMLSHSFSSGWESVSCGDSFEIDNSPETSFDAYTVSIGPWFGF